MFELMTNDFWFVFINSAHRATLGLAPISADVDENGEEVEEAIDEDQQAYDNYQRQKEEREQAAKKKEILDRIEKYVHLWSPLTNTNLHTDILSHIPV